MCIRDSYNAGGLQQIVNVEGDLASLNISAYDQSIIFTTDKDTVNSIIINGTTYNSGDATYTAPNSVGLWGEYKWELPNTQDTLNFFAGLYEATPSIQLNYSEGIAFTGKAHDVLLDHRIKVPSSITTTTQLEDLLPDMDANTRYVDYRGGVVATGDSAEAKTAVLTHLTGTHDEDGATVANYVHAGQPYTFLYTLSKQVFKPVEGDATSLARFQIRSVTFNFNNTGSFEVIKTTTGREPTSATFTGRVLGEVSNVLGYSSVVENDSFKVGVQSQASETNLSITNDTHLPCMFQSAEWEGFVVLRQTRQ